MTTPDTDVLALAAARRLADGLRRGAVELRGVTAAPGSGLHAAAAAVDELIDLVLADINYEPPGDDTEPTEARPTEARPTEDPYDLLPEG